MSRVRSKSRRRIRSDPCRSLQGPQQEGVQRLKKQSYLYTPRRRRSEADATGKPVLLKLLRTHYDAHEPHWVDPLPERVWVTVPIEGRKAAKWVEAETKHGVAKVRVPKGKKPGERFMIPFVDQQARPVNFNSDKSLLTRESLRFHPEILRILQQTWDWTDFNCKGNFAKDDYITMLLVIYPYLYADEQHRHTHDEIVSITERDYKKDSFEDSYWMEESLFKQALFALADRWTDEISVESYSRFLRWIAAILRAHPSDAHQKSAAMRKIEQLQLLYKYRFAKQITAIILIQKQYRGWRARKHYRWIKAEKLACQNGAARCIQSFCRKTMLRIRTRFTTKILVVATAAVQAAKWAAIEAASATAQAIQQQSSVDAAWKIYCKATDRVDPAESLAEVSAFIEDDPILAAKCSELAVQRHSEVEIRIASTNRKASENVSRKLATHRKMDSEKISRMDSEAMEEAAREKAANDAAKQLAKQTAEEAAAREAAARLAFEAASRAASAASVVALQAACDATRGAEAVRVAALERLRLRRLGAMAAAVRVALVGATTARWCAAAARGVIAHIAQTVARSARTAILASEAAAAHQRSATASVDEAVARVANHAARTAALASAEAAEVVEFAQEEVVAGALSEAARASWLASCFSLRLTRQASDELLRVSLAMAASAAIDAYAAAEYRLGTALLDLDCLFCEAAIAAAQAATAAITAKTHAYVCMQRARASAVRAKHGMYVREQERRTVFTCSHRPQNTVRLHACKACMLALVNNGQFSRSQSQRRRYHAQQSVNHRRGSIVPVSVPHSRTRWAVSGDTGGGSEQELGLLCLEGEGTSACQPPQVPENKFRGRDRDRYHSHGHSHSHGHGHSHSHSHNHSHNHNHSHSYSHDHDHGYDHDSGHGHDHEHRKGFSRALDMCNSRMTSREMVTETENKEGEVGHTGHFGGDFSFVSSTSMDPIHRHVESTLGVSWLGGSQQEQHRQQQQSHHTDADDCVPQLTIGDFLASNGVAAAPATAGRIRAVPRSRERHTQEPEPPAFGIGSGTGRAVSRHSRCAHLSCTPPSNELLRAHACYTTAPSPRAKLADGRSYANTFTEVGAHHRQQPNQEMATLTSIVKILGSVSSVNGSPYYSSSNSSHSSCSSPQSKVLDSSSKDLTYFGPATEATEATEAADVAKRNANQSTEKSAKRRIAKKLPACATACAPRRPVSAPSARAAGPALGMRRSRLLAGYGYGAARRSSIAAAS